MSSLGRQNEQFAVLFGVSSRHLKIEYKVMATCAFKIGKKNC